MTSSKYCSIAGNGIYEIVNRDLDSEYIALKEVYTDDTVTEIWNVAQISEVSVRSIEEYRIWINKHLEKYFSIVERQRENTCL